MLKNICKIILPKKWYFKLFVGKYIYKKNPLHNNQKYAYWSCGCGSGKKVRFCCGKAKLITYAKYDSHIEAISVWEKYLK